MSNGYTLSRPLARIVTRFAEVVCPPENASEQLVVATVKGLESYLSGLPRSMRVMLIVLFVLFDQQARFARRTRFRRFVNLGQAASDEYVHECLARSPGMRRTIATTLKGIVTFNYYELPEVKARLGYVPDAYIASVSERRLRLHGEDVRRGEAALLANGDEQ